MIRKIWNREATPTYLAMSVLAGTATYLSALHGLLG